MSVSLFIASFPYRNEVNIGIARSGWAMFLKFFGHIPEMFVHFFEIILIFLYVCQSVIWLTFLLKLNKYWDISGFR